MQRTFLQAKKYLEEQFPHGQLVVEGSNSPIPPWVQLLLNILSAIQLFTMACTVFGEAAFLGRRPPQLYHFLRERGILFLVAVFWVLPQILNKWVMTGAFEVTVVDDGDGGDAILLFSKLQMGRMPTALELTEPLVQMGLVQTN